MRPGAPRPPSSDLGWSWLARGAGRVAGQTPNNARSASPAERRTCSTNPGGARNESVIAKKKGAAKKPRPHLTGVCVESGDQKFIARPHDSAFTSCPAGSVTTPTPRAPAELIVPGYVPELK